MNSTSMSPDFRTIMTNASGKKAYPIAGVTYLLVPASFSGMDKAAAMKQFLTWIFSAGQKSALALEYDLLPSELLERAAGQIDRIR